MCSLFKDLRNWIGNNRPKLVLLFTIIIFSSGANAQWSTQSPVPTYLEISGVAASTAQNVFISTMDNPYDSTGALFESNDGGATWITCDIPVSQGFDFYGLFFLDSQNGWAYGEDNYRTSDGGATWAQLPGFSTTLQLEFYTLNFGMRFGYDGRKVTRDGGLTWDPAPNDIFAFDFTDNQTGLGISPTGVYRTSDGGNTFHLVHAGDAKSVVFLSPNMAVGIVDSSFIRSTDGGVTWNSTTSTNGRSYLVRVSANVVLAWGRSGTYPNYDDRIFRSSDGGQTWTDLGEIMDRGFYSVSFAFAIPDSQTVVAFDGIGNLYHSSDSGQTWTLAFPSRGGVLPSFQGNAAPVFVDGSIGYFAFGSGFVIKTTDGGASWSQISSGTGQSLNDIDRFANGNLIAVGDNGTVLTNSGGTSQWILQPAISQYKINAVQVVGPSEVVSLDEIGQVYMSSDGGESWTAASTMPPDLSPAEDIHFNTLLEGWVIGQSGNSLHYTSDGGNTWIPISDFGGAYVSIDVEGLNIWANNVTGSFSRSTDNGNSWIQGALSGYPHQIQDMDFYDANIGYAVGWWCEAFRSSDGGATWQVLPTPNGDDQLTDIYLIGPNELWVSTNNNSAYYSANGGLGWAVLDIGSTGYGTFSAIAADSIGNAWTVGDQGYIEHFTGPPPPPLNQPPSGSFVYQATGLSVDFTDTSTDLDGTIVSWYWDFADGNFSTEQNPTHVYSVANTYWVELTVTDDDGATGIGGGILTVQPLPGGTYGDFTEVTPLDSLFFTPQNEDFWVITTAPADYDSDGDLDIAVLGYYVVYNQNVEYRLVLLVNNGPADSTRWDFSYIEVPLGTLTTGESDMAWGDVDGDGDQDLAVGTDGETVIYRNDAGMLIITDTNLPSYWEDNDQADFDLRSLTWVDFDNDGDQDLLIPSVWNGNTFSYQTALMRNDGPNSTGGWIFTEVDSVFASTRHAQSAWADFDNDQDLDLLLVNISPLFNDGFIRRYRNDGGGNFVGEDILDSLTIEHGEAQWGDYDSDGDLDILVAGHIKELNGSYNVVLRIYRNDNEIYVPIDVNTGGGWWDLTAATWADYDSDGDMDILLAGNYNSGTNIEGRARIYTNSSGIFTGDTSNTLPAPRASGDRGGTFSWLDLDNDGDLDYFIAGQYFVPGGNGLVESQMHAYRNDVAGQNIPPTAPSSLLALVQPDSSILLSWTAANDDHTPSAALTYDLEIFQNNIPVTIPSRVPQPGNLSAVTQWILEGLPDGHYAWTVRAVDNAYNGGQIAQGDFNIGIVSGTEPGDEIPKQFALSKNYPNPFNPTTTFTFTLPKQSKVELVVYDLNGQLITKLVNGIRQAGKHEVRWDASNFASGTYFVRILTAEFTKTQKVLLMK